MNFNSMQSLAHEMLCNYCIMVTGHETWIMQGTDCPKCGTFMNPIC